VAILATFTVLAFWFRADLKQPLALRRQSIPEFSLGALVVVSGRLICVIAVMMVVSHFGDDFGIPALVAASSVALFTSCFQQNSRSNIGESVLECDTARCGLVRNCVGVESGRS